MSDRFVLVINPNSSPSATEAIRQAADAVQLPGTVFVTEQLDDGPAVIESDDDHAEAAEAILRSIAERVAGYSCVVLACHGDPGLVQARELVQVPVLGIGETSVLAAATATRSVGVITLGDVVRRRKWRQLRAMGLEHRCVAVEPTGTGVLHALSGNVDLEPYLAAGRAAIEKGAGALVLGCAGMVTLRQRQADALGVPVVEPVVATCLAAASVLGVAGAPELGAAAVREPSL